MREVDNIKKYRNEWKYCCIVNDLRMIENRLSAVLNKDLYSNDDGRYEIHSLYFDDYKDTCARENDAGIAKRFKWRIRYYGSQTQILRLERKEKVNGLCYKESCLISPEEYQKIMDGDAEEVLWMTEEVLLKQFCLQCMVKKFEPKAIIHYERAAYVEDITNIRITLDENISVSDDFLHFLDGDYIQYPVMEKGQHVLEVKFDYILPGYIKHIVTNRCLAQSSFSKYYMGRKILQNLRR